MHNNSNRLQSDCNSLKRFGRALSKQMLSASKAIPKRLHNNPNRLQSDCRRLNRFGSALSKQVHSASRAITERFRIDWPSHDDYKANAKKSQSDHRAIAQPFTSIERSFKNFQSDFVIKRRLHSACTERTHRLHNNLKQL